MYNVYEHLLLKSPKPNLYPLKRRCLTAVLSLHFFVSTVRALKDVVVNGNKLRGKKEARHVASEYTLQRACGECSHGRQKDWKNLWKLKMRSHSEPVHATRLML